MPFPVHLPPTPFFRCACLQLLPQPRITKGNRILAAKMVGDQRPVLLASIIESKLPSIQDPATIAELCPMIWLSSGLLERLHLRHSSRLGTQ